MSNVSKTNAILKSLARQNKPVLLDKQIHQNAEQNFIRNLKLFERESKNRSALARESSKRIVFNS